MFNVKLTIIQLSPNNDIDMFMESFGACLVIIQ